MRQPDRDARAGTRGSVTLGDVARRAGVSSSTASRALSGISVREVSRERVLRAALELGYQVNLSAQATARGTSNLIAVVVDDLREQHTSALVRGIVKRAGSRSVLVTVLCGDTHPGGLRTAVRAARELRPRAMIVTSGHGNAAEREALTTELDAYENAGGRLVRVGSAAPGGADCNYDERGAAAALAVELFRTGYRRPLILSGPVTDRQIEERAQGFAHGFQSVGVDADNLSLVRTTPDREGTRRVLDEMGAQDLVLRADVLMCPDDRMASAAYSWLRRQGLRVGVGVAVAGFGGHETSTALRPRLTTVEIPSVRLGETAAEMGLDPGPRAPVSHPLSLRVRESTPRRSVPDGHAPSGRTTIHDVAFASHVSVATATDIIIHNSEVNAAVSALVRQTASDLGFRAPTTPSPTGRTGVLSAIVPGLSNHLFQDTLASFGVAAAAAGMRVTVTDSQGLGSHEAELILRLRKQSDGVFLCAPMMATEALERLLTQLRPVVVLDAPCDTSAGQVGVEYAEGMQMLLEHLHALGHRRVVHLMGPDSSASQGERERGIRMFSSTHPGMRIDRLPCGGTLDDGYDAWPRVRDSGATAALAFNDMVAIGLLGRLQAEGVDVPRRLSVTGMDDVAFARFTSPPLTTMSIPLGDVGQAVWRSMETQLAGGPAPTARRFEPTIVVRGSTGPPPPA